MHIFLLFIVYLTFFSIGLPDALLGSAWPSMYSRLGVPSSWAGILTMLLSVGTVISSLNINNLIQRFGIWRITTFGILISALSLLGISVSNHFLLLGFFMLPFGLSAGAVDASLNHFVALHYSSRAMSWLHACWGAGASLSPFLMKQILSRNLGWQHSYQAVSCFQIFLFFILISSLPAWKTLRITYSEPAASKTNRIRLLQVIQMRGVLPDMVLCFAYSSLLQTTILWASSYLVSCRKFSAADAAGYASLFCIGLMFGRFLCGIIANRFGDKLMIFLGSTGIAAGVFFLLLPVSHNHLTLAGLCAIGFGCSPIFPSILHSVKTDFGAEKAPAIIGVLMASAYIGNIFMPFLFGTFSAFIGISFFPIYLTVLFVLIAVSFWFSAKQTSQK